MAERNFEEKLDDLVTEAYESGLDPDEVISGLEVKLMALKEESAQADEPEAEE